MAPAPGPTKSRFLTIITGGFEQDFIPPLAPCSPVAEMLTHPYHNTHAIFILSEEKSYTNNNFQPIKKCLSTGTAAGSESVTSNLNRQFL